MKKKCFAESRKSKTKSDQVKKKSLNSNFLKVSLFAGKWCYEHGNILLALS